MKAKFSTTEKRRGREVRREDKWQRMTSIIYSKVSSSLSFPPSSSLWQIFCFLVSCSCGRQWGGKEQPPFPIHSRRVLFRYQSHHWSRLCCKEYGVGWEENQSANLGHRCVLFFFFSPFHLSLYISNLYFDSFCSIQTAGQERYQAITSAYVFFLFHLTFLALCHQDAWFQFLLTALIPLWTKQLLSWRTRRSDSIRHDEAPHLWECTKVVEWRLWTRRR